MNPKRSEVVTVAASGDFGKLRPAVVIQSDVFPGLVASMMVCQIASTLEDAATSGRRSNLRGQTVCGRDPGSRPTNP